MVRFGFIAVLWLTMAFSAFANGRDVRRLIDKLHSPNAAVRAAAAYDLSWKGPLAHEAVPLLLAAMKDPDETVRFNAAAALGAIGKPGAAGLIALLNDPDPEIRGNALHGLHAMKEDARDALPKLLKLLRKDPVPQHRARAARALGVLGKAAIKAVPDLQRALTDPDHRVRSAAIKALGDIGPDARDAVPDLIRLLRRGKAPTLVLSTLGKMGLAAVDAIPAILPLLDDPDESGLAESAAYALGYIGHGSLEVITALACALHCEGGLVRSSVCDALAGLGAPAVPALIGKLSDPNEYVRSYAACGLGYMGRTAQRAMPFLLQLLSDEEEMVRNAARYAISCITGRRIRQGS